MAHQLLPCALGAALAHTALQDSGSLSVMDAL